MTCQLYPTARWLTNQDYYISQEPNMDNLGPDDFAGLQMVYP